MYALAISRSLFSILTLPLVVLYGLGTIVSLVGTGFLIGVSTRFIFQLHAGTNEVFDPKFFKQIKLVSMVGIRVVGFC